MNKKEYDKLFELEEDHWWYVSLRERVFNDLNRYIVRGKDNRILDAGCGTGFSLLRLESFGNAFGLDISGEAIGFCRKRGLNRLILGSVSPLPCKENIFNIIISLDVLYHKDVGCDKDVLREFYNALQPGGLLIINVPAFEFIRSEHDLAIHTKRRYTRDILRQKIEDANFTIERITYRNIFLFPLIMMFRIYKNFRFNLNRSESDLKRLPFWLNSFLISILNVEALFFDKSYAPFGLSVYCIARKK